MPFGPGSAASTAIWTEDLSNCQLDQDLDLRVRLAVRKQFDGEQITTSSDGFIVQACCGEIGRAHV